MNVNSKVKANDAAPDAALADHGVDAEVLARARAQYQAGEAIPGDAVFKWLAAWGSDNELHPPHRPIRRS